MEKSLKTILLRELFCWRHAKSSPPGALSVRCSALETSSLGVFFHGWMEEIINGYVFSFVCGVFLVSLLVFDYGLCDLCFVDLCGVFFLCFLVFLSCCLLSLIIFECFPFLKWNHFTFQCLLTRQGIKDAESSSLSSASAKRFQTCYPRRHVFRLLEKSNVFLW